MTGNSAFVVVALGALVCGTVVLTVATWAAVAVVRIRWGQGTKRQ